MSGVRVLAGAINRLAAALERIGGQVAAQERRGGDALRWHAMQCMESGNRPLTCGVRSCALRAECTAIDDRAL